jgi:hypothetical protein
MKMKRYDFAVMEDMVYKSLSRTEWKRSIQIIREINGGRRSEDEVSIAQIHTALDRAELAGWVERRVVSQASLGRKPVERAEYKLTGGLRKTKEKKSLLGNLVPKQA